LLLQQTKPGGRLPLSEPKAKLPAEPEPVCGNEVMDAGLGKPPNRIARIAKPVVHVSVFVARQVLRKSTYGQSSFAIVETIAPGRTEGRSDRATWQSVVEATKSLTEPRGRRDFVTG
jgi:hypothetical protein